MSKGLISINKNSKIKYLRDAFKIDSDTWKVNIVKRKVDIYEIRPIHSWQNYEFGNEVYPGYQPLRIGPDNWFHPYCEQWLKHQTVLDYNKSIKTMLKKLG